MQHILKSGTSAIAAMACLAVALIGWREYRISPDQHSRASVLTTVPAKTTLPAPDTSSTQDFPQPSASASDADLLAMARRIVASSPAQALSWAESQADPGLEQRMMLATLRAWGESDPPSVVDWVLAQDETAREAYMRAAMTGAASQPEVAMQVARALLANDPDRGPAYASMLAGAFCADGNYQDALRFINSTAAGSMTDPVKVVFNEWAQRQPQAAMQAVDDIADPQLRAAAFSQGIATWSANDPAGLAAYAETLTPGSDRTCTLNTAINNWSLQDPAAMAGWLNTLPPGPDYDAGVNAMLARTDGANRPPETAMQWVENIGDPALQQDSFTRILAEWTQSDPAAARQYVANATWLDQGQRQTILAGLGK